MARLAEKNGCLTMAGFQRRFSPLILEAKKRIEERGAVTQCVARFVKNYVGGEPYYRGATDILTCDAIHSVDILRFICGEVKRVASDVANFHADYDNAFNALMKFENGACGILLTNWAAGKRTYCVEIYGKGIHACVDPEDRALIYRDGSLEAEVISVAEKFKDAKIYQYAGFLHENRHFIDCIKQGKEPVTNFSDAVKTMELVDRIYDSQI
jgi:virulence factor